jgi:hypothetical protein
MTGLAASPVVILAEPDRGRWRTQAPPNPTIRSSTITRTMRPPGAFQGPQPTALRDIAGVAHVSSPTTISAPSSVLTGSWPNRRAATSFFTNTNFTGQVNFPRRARSGRMRPFPTIMPRGIAYASLSAGRRSGDWPVRAAMTPGSTFVGAVGA